MTPTAASLAGWTPVGVNAGQPEGDPPSVDWCYTEGIDFTDPFFDQTIERCLRHPFRLLFQQQTPIVDLPALQSDEPGLGPSGFIFHLSRCGSTLVTQMLGALPAVVALSEPGPLDTLLRLRWQRPDVSEEDQLGWLLAMVSILTRRRRPEQGHAVVKFDAWATLALPLILRAFPETPWIFIARDPVEVLVSQVASRAYHMVPGALPPEVLGLPASEVLGLPDEEYLAAVLAAICRAALESGGRARSLFVDYRQLPGAVPSLIAPHFGIDPGPDGLAAMAAAAGRNAKNPSAGFEPDSASKQAQASEQVRASARRVQQVYESLPTASGLMPGPPRG